MNKQEHILHLLDAIHRPYSYAEIAQDVGCSKRWVKKVVDNLVKEKVLEKIATNHTIKRGKNTLHLHGKNMYRLTKLEEEKRSKSSVKSFIHHKNVFLENNSLKREFAKHFEILEISYIQKWWLKDKKKLRKAMWLMIKKKEAKFQFKNPMKFLSFLLKHGVFGFQRHKARYFVLNVLKEKAKAPIGEAAMSLDMKKYLDSLPPPAADGLSQAAKQGELGESAFLVNLYENLGTANRYFDLDISIDSMESYLRRGTQALNLALTKLLDREPPEIKNAKEYLLSLIHLKIYNFINTSQNKKVHHE